MNTAEQIQKVNEVLATTGKTLVFGYGRDNKRYFGRIQSPPTVSWEEGRSTTVFGDTFFEALANTLASLVGP